MASSKNLYNIPLKRLLIEYQTTNSPGHPGPYAHAVDFAVPVDTEVMSPADGEIITVVDSFSEYGPSPGYGNKANYIQIRHANGETSDLMHLAQGSVGVKVGDKLKQGDFIAKTGLSGYMTAPHLHWMVWRVAATTEGFISLEPNLADGA